jgi:hypothetical protein
MTSAFAGQQRAVRFLVDAGASRDVVSPTGETLAFLAEGQGINISFPMNPDDMKNVVTLHDLFIEGTGNPHLKRMIDEEGAYIWRKLLPKLVLNNAKTRFQFGVTCSIPDDHIDPRRSAFFMARSVLRDIRDRVQPC